MEARLSARNLLGKCAIFWSQLAAEMEDFHLHILTTKYGDSASGSDSTKCWIVVLTMVRVIRRNTRKVCVQAEKAYELTSTNFMVGKYLWSNLQSQQVINKFL